MAEPHLPAFLADILEDAFSELPGIRLALEFLAFTTKLYAMNRAGHGNGSS